MLENYIKTKTRSVDKTKTSLLQSSSDWLQNFAIPQEQCVCREIFCELADNLSCLSHGICWCLLVAKNDVECLNPMTDQR